MNAREYYLSIVVQRGMWKMSMPQLCMWCGKISKWPGLQVHEMCRRSQASRSWGHPCNYLLLDQECHENLFSTMPLALQLAVKKIKDPLNYDLEKWLEIRKTGEVDEEAVDAEVSFLLKEHYGIRKKGTQKGLVF